MTSSENANINFYWFTQEQIVKIWNHITQSTEYRSEKFADICFKVMLQINMPTIISKVSETDPHSYPFSAGEALVPTKLFEEICTMTGMKYLVGELLLENSESAANILHILPQRENM